MVAITWLAVAGLVLLLDQATKTLVLSRHASGRLRAGGSRWIRPVHSTGLGFGFIADRRVLAVIWCTAVAGIFGSIRYLAPFQPTEAQIALGAAVGGASGNFLDMLRRGAVIDFIDLRHWPVFNL